jgi:hypothetical protein
MTNLLAIFFVIGISLVLMIFALITKNTILIIVAGLGWIVTSIFLFSLYYSGDPDYGLQVFGFSWMAILLGMTCFFSSWWIHRKKTIELADDKTGQGFYTDNDPDYKEFEEMYKARSNRKKMRGR